MPFDCRLVLTSCVVILSACDGPYTFIPPGYEDAAAKSRDVVTYLARQRHAQVAFGNAEGGSARSLEGKRARVGLRLSAAGVATPELRGAAVRTGEAEAGTFPVTSGVAASLTLEGAVKLFGGAQRDERRFVTIDVLSRAVLASGLPGGDLHVRSARLGGSVGMRVGLTDDRGDLPAIAVVGMQGRLPGFHFASEPAPMAGGGTVTMRVADARLSAGTLRATASKRVGRLEVTAGYGVDILTAEAEVQSSIAGRTDVQPGTATIAVNDEMRRTILFGGASYQLRGVTLGGEIGVVGGERGPFERNRFRAGGGSRPYLSVGVRVGN